MTVDDALDIAHQERRTGIHGGALCRDCVSCALILLASELRQERAKSAQMQKQIDSFNAAVQLKRLIGSQRCHHPLVDGICAVCDL